MRDLARCCGQKEQALALVQKYYTQRLERKGDISKLRGVPSTPIWLKHDIAQAIAELKSQPTASIRFKETGSRESLILNDMVVVDPPPPREATANEPPVLDDSTITEFRSLGAVSSGNLVTSDNADSVNVTTVEPLNPLNDMVMMSPILAEISSNVGHRKRPRVKPLTQGIEDTGQDESDQINADSKMESYKRARPLTEACTFSRSKKKRLTTITEEDFQRRNSLIDKENFEIDEDRGQEKVETYYNDGLSTIETDSNSSSIELGRTEQARADDFGTPYYQDYPDDFTSTDNSCTDDNASRPLIDESLGPDLEMAHELAMSSSEKVRNWSTNVLSSPLPSVKNFTPTVLLPQLDGGSANLQDAEIYLPEGPPKGASLSHSVGSVQRVSHSWCFPTERTPDYDLSTENIKWPRYGPSGISAADFQKFLPLFQPEQWLSSLSIDVALSLVPATRRWKVLTAAYLIGQEDGLKEMSKFQIPSTVTGIIAPLHLKHGGGHWCMGVLDLVSSTVEFYDPLPGNHRSIIIRILQRLADFISQECGRPRTENWAFSEMNANKELKQQNTWDCGIFTIVVIVHRLIDRSLPTSICGRTWRTLFGSILAQHADGIVFESQGYDLPITSTKNVDPISVKRSIADTKSRLEALHNQAETIQSILGHISTVRYNITLSATSTNHTLEAFDRIAELLQRDIPPAFLKPMDSGCQTSRGMMLRCKESADAAIVSVDRLAAAWNVEMIKIRDARERGAEAAHAMRTRVLADIESSLAAVDQDREALDARKRELEEMKAAL